MTEPKIAKGLAGVYADTTRISCIFPTTSTLTYYGYPVQELAEYCGFEEVAYLLWHGELPTASQLEQIKKSERAARALPDEAMQLLRKFRKDVHPMDVLRTMVSFLGAQDPAWEDASREANLEKSIRLFARIPTIIAAAARLSKGLEPVPPRDDLGFAENFFNMYFGNMPEKDIIHYFEASLVFYAEHGFNASTFAAREITSTLSDIYSAVTGAIGALKGSLHGGANEAVMYLLLEIGSPEKAQAWIDDALATKKKIMGFGHRVYRDGDSRVPHMTEYFHKIALLKGGEKWVQIEDILEKAMLAHKQIHPNLDFPVGPAYYLMGFDIPVFTPIFVMSRVTGWTAHVMEQLEDNKIMRPLAVYTGVEQRSVKPIAERRA